MVHYARFGLIPPQRQKRQQRPLKQKHLDFPQQTAAEKLETSIHPELEECEISVEFGDLSELVEQAAEQFFTFMTCMKI